jgi:hypothetical protein
MSMWCNWNGKKDMGKFYVSQASRVAQHLGLFGEHEENTQSSDLTSRKQQKAIAVIAWGFFNFQTLVVSFLRWVTLWLTAHLA